jgi:hypothetical protein
MSTSEEALGGGGAVGATDVKIVHGGERHELGVAESMATVVKQRKLPVATFHSGTAALEQIGTFTGHLLDALLQGGRELLQRMGRLAKRLEQLLTEGAQSMARVGPGAAGGGTLEVDGRNQLLNDRLVHIKREIQRLDLSQERSEEKAQSGEQLG